MRVPILAGRYFTTDDDNRRVVIVDRQLADGAWPGRPAVGQRLLLPSATAPPAWVEVIGVVEHVQLDDLRGRGLPELFVTYVTRQYASLNVVVRGANAGKLAGAVEAAVMRLGPGRPVHDIRFWTTTSPTHRPTRGSRCSCSAPLQCSRSR